MTNIQNDALSGVPADANPPIVVDVDLDDIEEPEFSRQRFRVAGDVYTLILADDYLLAEFSQWAGDGDVVSLYRDFYAEVLESAVDQNGAEIKEPYKHLWAKVESRDISIKKVSKMAMDAIETWTEELTDTSMRPRRRNRADRRAASRRR